MADEEKKEEFPQGVWQHDQELSFKKVTPQLSVVADAIRKAINAEKAKLSQMVGARDSIRRK